MSPLFIQIDAAEQDDLERLLRLHITSQQLSQRIAIVLLAAEDLNNVVLDIKRFFYSMDHDHLMRALQFHTSECCMLLHLRCWLEASVKLPDGSLQSRTRGTPHYGAISP